jgi:hypothetical protein
LQDGGRAAVEARGQRRNGVAEIETELHQFWRVAGVGGDVSPFAQSAQERLDVFVDERHGDACDAADGEERKKEAAVGVIGGIGDEKNQSRERSGIE